MSKAPKTFRRSRPCSKPNYFGKCAYCGVTDFPLEVEHIYPKSRGWSNPVYNLTLACQPCNQTKGNQDVGDFLSEQTALATKILKQAKAPLKDVAAVNSTRWALFKLLKTTGLPVTIGTDARTKFNRRRFDLPKEHWIDAACVGKIESLTLLTTQPLLVQATGHGCRQVIPMNKYFHERARKQKSPFLVGTQEISLTLLLGKMPG